MPELMDTHQKLSVALEKVVCMVTGKMHTSTCKFTTASTCTETGDVYRLEACRMCTWLITMSFKDQIKITKCISLQAVPNII